MKRKVKINPDKLANTFGIPWTHPTQCIPETGGDEVMTGAFHFSLHEEGKLPITTLKFGLSDPRSVTIDIEPPNDYYSRINFEGITDVKYVPEYRLVEFRRQTASTWQLLTVMSRGQVTYDSQVAKGSRE